MLIWLENSPTFGEDGDEEVTSLIDKIITCKKPGSDADLLKLVNRQIHRHSWLLLRVEDTADVKK